MQTVVEDETIISKRTDEFVSSARLIEVYGHLREANLIFPTIPQAANRPRLFKSSNFQANRVPSPSLTRLSASLVRNTNMYTFVSSSSLHSMKNHTRIDSWVCNFGMAYCILTSQYDVSSKAERDSCWNALWKSLWIWRAGRCSVLRPICTRCVRFGKSPSTHDDGRNFRDDPSNALGFNWSMNQHAAMA